MDTHTTHDKTTPTGGTMYSNNLISSERPDDLGYVDVVTGRWEELEWKLPLLVADSE